MKRTMLFLICFLVPLIAFAGSHSIFRPAEKGALPQCTFRGFRLNEQIEYGKIAESWLEDSKLQFHYPNASTSKPDSIYHYEWDEEGSAWVQSMFSEYMYNQAGRVTGINNYMQVSPEMVWLVSSTESEFDNQNRLIHFTMKMLNPMDFTLIPFMLLHFTYGNNNVSSIRGWMSDDEIPYWITNFQHDGQGRVIEEVEQSSLDSLAWENSYRVVTTYHPNDTSTGASNVEYVATYYPSAFGQNMYYLAGMPQQYLIYEWEERGWVLSERETYSWDGGNNHLINILSEDMIGENWEPYYREVYTYDNNNNISQVISSDYSENAWLEHEKEVLTWTILGSANEDFNSPAVADLKINTYPMPFTYIVSIDLQSPKAGMIDVNIYNLKGQQIQAFKTLPGQNISWNGTDMQGRACASGIYFVKAKQNTTEAAVRIIKLK